MKQKTRLDDWNCPEKLESPWGLNSAVLFVYLLIYGLLMDTVGSSEYVASIGRIINE
jgi:hypothetical protein